MPVMTPREVSQFPTSPFLFTVCQVGAEGALKNEVLRSHPELRFAYSRPGFVIETRWPPRGANDWADLLKR